MKRITILALILCLLLSGQVVCYADSESSALGNTVITVTVPETVELTVTADCAEVSYNGLTGTSFQVPRNEAFVLTINPEDGYEIVQVFLGDEDVTDKLSGNALCLDGVYESINLTVNTQQISSITSDDSSSIDDSSSVADSSSEDDSSSAADSSSEDDSSSTADSSATADTSKANTSTADTSSVSDTADTLASPNTGYAPLLDFGLILCGVLVLAVRKGKKDD